MPAILTHFAFAKDNYIFEERYHPLIAIGAMGPDTYFFYGYSLYKRPFKKEIRAFGTYLHHINVAKFYEALLDYALRQKEDEQKIYYAFIYGLLLHYILDRKVHPYVFYKTGFTIKEEEKFAYMYGHVYFESMMDSLVSKAKKIKMQNAKVIKNKKEDILKISKMLYEVSALIFKFSYLTPLSFYHAYLDMRFLEKLFTSRLGIKRFCYRLFCYKSQLYPQTNMNKVKYNDILDVLNDKKALWLDPSSGAPHHESFFELYEEASKEAKEIQAFIYDYISKKKTNRFLFKFISDINHDGEVIGALKRYMDYVYDKLPHRLIPFIVNN